MSHLNPFLLVVALLPAALLPAQNDPASRPLPGAAQRTGDAASDAILAVWLHDACNHEVALANVALKQATSPDVRTFAQRMIDEHTACAAKFEPFAAAAAAPAAKPGEGKRAAGEPGDGKRPATGEQGDGKPVDASGTPAAARLGGFDHAMLIRDLGKKCLQSDIKLLTTKTGVEFDRCYMAMQVASHMRGGDMTEVFGTYASERLRPLLKDTNKAIALDLEMATALCQPLKAQDAKSTGTHAPARDQR
jgi:predicted outer membrane protein